MKTCPYCKIDFEECPWAKGSKKVVCYNCKHYPENESGRSLRDIEASFATKYACWPHNWQEYTDWMTDPKWLK